MGSASCQEEADRNLCWPPLAGPAGELVSNAMSQDDIVNLSIVGPTLFRESETPPTAQELIDPCSTSVKTLGHQTGRNRKNNYGSDAR